MTHTHFIGIGGTGLSAIARVLHESGQTVTAEERYVYNAQGQMTELIDRRGVKSCFVHTTGAAGDATGQELAQAR